MSLALRADARPAESSEPMPAEAFPLRERAAHWLSRHPVLPFPGRGATLERWRVLADIAAEDVCLAKLLEAHYDAQAIAAELGVDGPGRDELWGVWAAEPPGDTLRFESGQAADPAAERGCLQGGKSWCSAAAWLTHALVTARQGERRVLAAVRLDGHAVIDDTCWQAVGMRRIDSGRVVFTDAPAMRIGTPDRYLQRPGFWHGGAGIAACWFGASCAIAARLRTDRRLRDDPHAAAHLGAIDVRLAALAALLRQTAACIDADPVQPHRHRVMQLRGAAEAAAREVIDRCARALGPGPLCNEGAHAQRSADLSIFIRQHHAERDLAALGVLASREATTWRL